MKHCQTPIYKKARFRIVVIVVILSVLVSSACGDSSTPSTLPAPNTSPSVSFSDVSTPSQAPSPTAEPSSDAPAGIDPDKFIPAVKEYISDLNAKNTGIGDLSVKISVTYIIGFVDISFTELTAWLSFTDTDKKEFIIRLGKALDIIAANNIYAGTLLAVGTDTTLNSPSGQKLAERTSLGIVRLY